MVEQGPGFNPQHKKQKSIQIIGVKIRKKRGKDRYIDSQNTISRVVCV
jgi:hypothetical protein